LGNKKPDSTDDLQPSSTLQNSTQNAIKLSQPPDID